MLCSLHFLRNFLGVRFIKGRHTLRKVVCFFSRRRTKRGGGVKPPEPLIIFFFFCIKKLPPHETQEKSIKINCMLCSVLVNIDQQKKVLLSIWKYYILKYKFWWFFFIHFLSILDHFQMIKQKLKSVVLNHTGLGAWGP